MPESANKSIASQQHEAQLDELVEEISAKLQSGKIVDLDRYTDEYPDLAESLRRLYPTLEAMAMMGFTDTDDAVLPPTDAANQRRTLGDYRIIKEIGRGGMGVVYEAEQLSLGRRVALKILPFAAVLDPRQLDRFKNEAFAAAQLHHTNIVPVYGIGCERGVYFYAMQLIEGQTLADMIRQLRQIDPAIQQEPQQPREICTDVTKSLLDKFGPQLTDADKDASSGDRLPDEQSKGSDKLARDTSPVFQAAISTERSHISPGYVRTIAQLGIQIAEALEHAHELGVVHRDIKPSNLILDQRHNVWITDFGLARIESNPGLTITGDLLGTLRYMSPEQSMGKQFALDHRTDIYSLGVTLYELLTLHPAVDGKDREQILNQIASRDPKSPRHWNAEIPLDLETIVLKAISKNPSDRYDNAQSFAADLQSFLDHKSILAKRPTTVQRLNKWGRRNPAILWSAVAILVVAACSLAISTVLISQSAKDTLAALKKADQNLQLAQQSEKQARTDAEIAKAVNEFVNTDLLGKADPHEEPNRDLTVGEVLDRAILAIEGQFVDQPLVEADIRTTIARSLLNLGRHDEAESQAIAIREILLDVGLDATDRRFLDVEIALAWILHERGFHKQCFEQMEPLLNLSRQYLGPEDDLTLDVSSRVADLRIHLGQYTQAEQQVREIVAIRERVCGANDDATLSAMQLLAKVIKHQGRYDEAEQFYREVYDIYKRQLGPEHPRTLSVQSGLADSISVQSRHEEAERMLRDVYGISRRVLGAAHHTTVGRLKLLAIVLLNNGRHDQAEALLRDSTEELAQMVGREHSLTLQLRAVLVKTLTKRGQYAEAEKIYRDLVDAGFADKNLEDLAELYRAQLKLAEAENAFRDLIESRKQRLGAEHPLTLNGLSNLAFVIHSRGRYAEAETLFREVADTLLRIAGEEHWMTLDSLTGLADTLVAQGRGLDATKIYEQVLDVQKRQLRLNHPSTLITMNNLARVFWLNDRLDKSIPIFEQLVSAHEKELGDDHPQTLAIVGNLGVNLKDAGRLDDAIPHLQRCYDAAGRHPNLLSFTSSLIDALVKSGKTDQASELVPAYLTQVRARLPMNMIAAHLAMLARDFYLPTEQYEKAEQVLREGLAILSQEMTNGQEYVVHSIEFRLGIALLGQKKIDDAEKMLSQGFDGMTSHRDSFSQRSRDNVIQSIEKVSRLFDGLHVENPSEGYEARAARWRANLENFQNQDHSKEPK